MVAINDLIRRNLVLFLSFGFLLGILFPSLGELSDTYIVVLLGAQIFVSSFAVDFRQGISLPAISVLRFYLFRFVLLPILLFFVASGLEMSEAPAFLLLALMPAGVTSAALTRLIGGSVELALVLTMVSSLLAPFVVPFIFDAVAEQSLQGDAWGMVQTILLTVVVPFLLHLPLRKVRRVVVTLRSYDAILIIPLMSAMIVLVIANQSLVIRADPWRLLGHVFWVSLLFGVLYFAGWLFSIGLRPSQRAACFLCSGLNNMALAIVLATLHLGPEVALLAVAGEFPWVLSLGPARRCVRLMGVFSRGSTQQDAY